MKYKILIVAVAAAMLYSCNSGSDKEEVIYETVIDSPEVSNEVDSNLIINKPHLWVVETDETKPEKLKQPTDKSLSNLNAAQIITEINASYPNIQLSLLGNSHDTVYIDIPASNYLTQSIGSTGAYNYMAMVVYNMTESQGTKYVNFKFKTGDHAEPGVYSREDFKRLR